jgi:hypothetical protein
MKKILSLALMVLGGFAMLTSCSTDNDSNPTIKSPTKFSINESPVADQYIQLAQDNNVNLTWSQPDYGYNAFATYQIQVGLVKDGQVTWYEKDGQPKYLATTYTVCNANISGEEISEVLCAIDGFKYAEDYVSQGYREVAFRVYSSINTSMKAEVAGTGILSDNYVTFRHMAAYNAIKSPGYIYLVGNCTDWQTPNAGNTEHYSAWRLFEKDDEIGSKVYYGTFELPAGAQFRFYRALTGWDQDSMGPQVDDSGVESAFSNGEFEGTIMTNKAKGTWLFSGFEGGTVEMMVDLNQNKVKFTVK